MKEIKQPAKIFAVELTLKEVEFIRNITQNNPGWDESDVSTALGLFVGASRLLGFDINDDGTINRNTGFGDHVF